MKRATPQAERNDMGTDEHNLFYGPIVRLRHMIAATPTFQALIEATGSEADKLAAALEKVHIVGLAGDAVAASRPYVEVDAGAEFTVRKHASNGRLTGGTLWLLIEADVPAEKKPGYLDAAKWFYQIFGNLIEDLLDDSVTTDPTRYNLTVREISLPYGPPAREEPKAKRGDYYQGIMTVEWGLR